MREPIDWEGCKQKTFAKTITPDNNLINYLIESASNREKTANLLPINETTKETIISLRYDVLRELLEALALKKGFKIYNHECYTHFLKTIIRDESFALEFDSLRVLRNRINYYGKKIDIIDTKNIIINLEKLIKKTKALL